MSSPSPVVPKDSATPAAPVKGGRRHGASVKTLKRMLKKAGLKTTGRKAALTRRAKKAHLKMGGGDDPEPVEPKSAPATQSSDPGASEGGRRRRRH